MPLYPFPNVPNAQGVPPLPRLPGNEISTEVQTVAAALSVILAGQVEQQWGIYDSLGQLIGRTEDETAALITSRPISNDAGPYTLAFDYRKGTAISDFPIEKGSFAAYNKVEMPGNPVVTLIVSGTIGQREAFVAAIDAACVSTELYSVVTPEITYFKYSIESYNYQRSNNRGANMLVVELTLKEIRTVSASYTAATPTTTAAIQEPQDPGATPQTNSGKVQPSAPPQSTLKSLAIKLGIGG